MFKFRGGGGGGFSQDTELVLYVHVYMLYTP